MVGQEAGRRAQLVPAFWGVKTDIPDQILFGNENNSVFTKWRGDSRWP